MTAFPHRAFRYFTTRDLFWLSVFTNLAVFSCFFVIIIFGGHGLGPLGLLILNAEGRSWEVHLAWTTLVGFAVSAFIKTPVYLILELAGVAGLAAVAVQVVPQSENAKLSAITALPFVAAAVYKICEVAVKAYRFVKLRKTQYSLIEMCASLFCVAAIAALWNSELLPGSVTPLRSYFIPSHRDRPGKRLLQISDSDRSQDDLGKFIATLPHRTDFDGLSIYSQRKPLDNSLKDISRFKRPHRRA